MTTEKQLPEIVITQDLAPTIYVANGLDQYLAQIAEATKAEVADVTTKKGRDRIASMAYSIARSKTAVEKPGRDFLKRLKEQPKEVEAELRRFTTECDKMRDDVRRPLTEWEEAEDSRQEALKSRIEEMRTAAVVADEFGNLLPSEEISERLKFVKSVEITEDYFQDMTAQAGVAKDAAVQKLEQALAMAVKREQEAAELERARLAKAEQDRKDEEERKQREIEERVKREADAAAQRDRDEAAQREADLRAAAEKSERERVEAQQKSEREAAEAKEKAEREKQQAIEAEQLKARQEADRIKREADQREADRLAEEQRVKAENEKRAQDKQHRDLILTDLRDDLVSAAGLTAEQARAVIVALMAGKIRGHKINF